MDFHRHRSANWFDNVSVQTKGASMKPVQLITLVALAGVAWYFYQREKTLALATPAGGAAITAAAQQLPVLGRQIPWYVS